MKLPLVGALALVCCRGALARPYLQRYSYMGADFFSGWTFWTDRDPSNGDVEYVDFAEAARAGLVNATRNRIYLGADMGVVDIDSTRRSIRIQSKATFNEGLFVATIDHAPTGCGIWPAFWMYGEDATHVWPSWGEYDIIEGVHGASNVMTSLHTTGNCDQRNAAAESLWMRGPSGKAAVNCDTYAKGQFPNQGCSQRGPHASLGEVFNAAGGGTYAAEWDPAARHIRTWFWPRGSEPLDLQRREPDSDSWGQPYSYFSLDPRVCSSNHFMNMRLVFDITFCGDLGESTFQRDCPDIAKYSSCPQFVKGSPGSMREAYWSIRDFDVYLGSGTVAVDHVSLPSQSDSGKSKGTSTMGASAYTVIAVSAVLVLAWFLLRKVHSGEIRCMTFYHRCLEEATGASLEHSSEQVVAGRYDQHAGPSARQPMGFPPFGFPLRRIVSL